MSALSRLCKDCEHLFSEFSGEYGVYHEGDWCRHPLVAKRDPVDGSLVDHDARKERLNKKGKCGPSGKKFEPIRQRTFGQRFRDFFGSARRRYRQFPEEYPR
jgi:hypothetical protein